MQTVETTRLIIRNWDVSDIPRYAAIVADPDVMQFVGNCKPQNFEETEKYINKYIRQIALTGWVRFAVEIKTTGELAGFSGFADYNNELDFGWRYAKKH